jgi:hypothetical protein
MASAATNNTKEGAPGVATVVFTNIKMIVAHGKREREGVRKAQSIRLY